MKKLVMTLLTVLSCGAAYALPVGNPSEASLLCDGVFCEGYCGDFCDPCLSWCDAWSIRLGFYGDYVFNRHMELDHCFGGSDIEDTELFTNAGYFAFNMWNRFDLFGTLGASNVWLKTPGRTFQALSNQYFTIATETTFSWSLGARATLLQCGCFAFGAEGQYFQAHPDIDYVQVEGAAPIYLDQGADLFYSEWQVGLGISYRINISSCATALVPYIAVKWSRAMIDMDNFIVPGASVDPTAILRPSENKKDAGFAVGATLVGCDKAALTVEGRFADEKALYVNGQFRF